jgi:sugar (pentulose or hexulose) kinase
VAVWQEVLAGTTGLPVHHRRSGQAASAGAALLAAGATVGPWDLDLLDPVAGGTHPDPALVDRYAALRPAADRLAADLVDPGSPPACD